MCAALVGFAWAAWPEPGRPGNPAGFDKETARYFNLPNGASQIGVSRVDSRYLAVRWRAPDGETWADPKTVYDAGVDMAYHSMRIRVAGPTLALVAMFGRMPDDNVDFEGFSADDLITVFVVCRDGACHTSREYDGPLYRPPQITPDGRHVFLGQRGDVYVTWQGDGIEEKQVSGLPEGDYGEDQPLLTPDGSLRAVTGASTPNGCDFTLLTTAPGETSYTAALSHLDTGDQRRTCTSDIDSFADDYVVVEGRSVYRPWFAARSGSGWLTVAEDPSGQVRYPTTSGSKLAGRFDVSGFWHWRRVLATSPDGRSLVVQVHRPGEERWGPPQEVLRAPEGSQCLEIVNKPTYTWDEEDPFYVHLTCRHRPASGAEWVYTYPTAVTDDGRTWHSFLATDSGLRVGRDMVFRGHPTYRWSPDQGLRRVDLPVPEGAVLSLLSDGTYALSSLVPSGSGCELQVQLAAPDATEWQRPVPSTAGSLPPGMCELDDVSSEGRNLYHHLDGPGRSPSGDRMIRLTWRGDPVPRLEEGP